MAAIPEFYDSDTDDEVIGSGVIISNLGVSMKRTIDELLESSKTTKRQKLVKLCNPCDLQITYSYASDEEAGILEVRSPIIVRRGLNNTKNDCYLCLGKTKTLTPCVFGNCAVCVSCAQELSSRINEVTSLEWFHFLLLILCLFTD